MIGLNRLGPVAALSAFAALSMTAVHAMAAPAASHSQQVAAKACHDAKGQKIACKTTKTTTRSSAATAMPKK